MVWLSNWWSQVSTTALHGLQITVVGMSLVFLTLGLIIVSLILLTQLPGLRGEKDVARASPSPAEEGPPVPDIERAQVAAIAIAIARSRFRARPRPTSGEGERGRRAWRQYGRAYQLGL